MGKETIMRPTIRKLMKSNTFPQLLKPVVSVYRDEFEKFVSKQDSNHVSIQVLGLLNIAFTNESKPEEWLVLCNHETQGQVFYIKGKVFLEAMGVSAKDMSYGDVYNTTTKEKKVHSDNTVEHYWSMVKGAFIGEEPKEDTEEDYAPLVLSDFIPRDIPDLTKENMIEAILNTDQEIITAWCRAIPETYFQFEKLEMEYIECVKNGTDEKKNECMKFFSSARGLEFTKGARHIVYNPKHTLRQTMAEVQTSIPTLKWS